MVELLLDLINTLSKAMLTAYEATNFTEVKSKNMVSEEDSLGDTIGDIFTSALDSEDKVQCESADSDEGPETPEKVSPDLTETESIPSPEEIIKRKLSDITDPLLDDMSDSEFQSLQFYRTLDNNVLKQVIKELQEKAKTCLVAYWVN